MNPDPKKKSLNKWLVFMNIPFQMGVIILLGVLLGKWIDEKQQNSTPVFTIILSLFSVFVALYHVIRQVKNISKQNE